MNVREVRYHRNGVGGEGFYAAIVTDPFDDLETRTTDFLVLTLPDATFVDDDGTETVEDRQAFTFVLALDDLAAGTVRHAWRGDEAASVCRQAVIDAGRAAFSLD